MSLVIGVVGFMFIEDYHFLDAFFMSTITISTVGFEEVKRLSDNGKLFASIYILFNLALFAFVISTVTTYIFEGELTKAYKSYTANRKIRKMKNHVIVCGYGRNGYNVCKELTKEGKTFVIIENDLEVAQMISEKFEYQVIIGDATLDETMHLAGIAKASYIITTLPSDAENVFISLTAKELNPDIFVVARASDLNSEAKLHRAGANRIVLPDALGGLHMAQLVTKPSVIEFLDLLSGVGGEIKLQLEEFRCEDFKPEYQNVSIRDLNIRRRTEATIIAFKDIRKGFVFNPNPEIIISDQILIVLGTDESVEKFKVAFLNH
jgi:voltage-gated potassium channel